MKREEKIKEKAAAKKDETYEKALALSEKYRKLAEKMKNHKR